MFFLGVDFYVGWCLMKMCYVLTAAIYFARWSWPDDVCWVCKENMRETNIFPWDSAGQSDGQSFGGTLIDPSWLHLKKINTVVLLKVSSDSHVDSKKEFTVVCRLAVFFLLLIYKQKPNLVLFSVSFFQTSRDLSAALTPSLEQKLIYAGGKSTFSYTTEKKNP